MRLVITSSLWFPLSLASYLSREIGSPGKNDRSLEISPAGDSLEEKNLGQFEAEHSPGEQLSDSHLNEQAVGEHLEDSYLTPGEKFNDPSKYDPSSIFNDPSKYDPSSDLPSENLYYKRRSKFSPSENLEFVEPKDSYEIQEKNSGKNQNHNKEEKNDGGYKNNKAEYSRGTGRKEQYLIPSIYPLGIHEDSKRVDISNNFEEDIQDRDEDHEGREDEGKSGERYLGETALILKNDPNKNDPKKSDAPKASVSDDSIDL